MIALIAALAMTTMASQATVCAFDAGTKRIMHAGKATPNYEAGAKPWFGKKDVLAVNGATYTPVGGPMTLASSEFSSVVMKDGVPILAKGADAYQPEKVYLLVSSADCRFQPYVKFYSESAK